jgi:hypothetical protein
LKILATAADFARGPVRGCSPYDLFSHWFDYRAYLDLVVERLAGVVATDNELKNLVLAAVNRYAVLTGSMENWACGYAQSYFHSINFIWPDFGAPGAADRQQSRTTASGARRLVAHCRHAYWQPRALKKRQRSTVTGIDDLESRILHMAGAVLRQNTLIS